jgi:hypothetical protein
LALEHNSPPIVDFGPGNLCGHLANYSGHQGFLRCRYGAHPVRDSGDKPMPLVMAAKKSLSVRRKQKQVPLVRPALE